MKKKKKKRETDLLKASLKMFRGTSLVQKRSFKEEGETAVE